MYCIRQSVLLAPIVTGSASPIRRPNRNLCASDAHRTRLTTPASCAQATVVASAFVDAPHHAPRLSCSTIAVRVLGPVQFGTRARTARSQGRHVIRPELTTLLP